MPSTLATRPAKPRFFKSIFAVFVMIVGSACAPEQSGFLKENDVFQIGPDWGRHDVTQEAIDRKPAFFQTMAKATGKLTYKDQTTGPTAFYLGYHLGHHYMATNNHVIEAFRTCFLTNENNCEVTFPFLIDKFDEPSKAGVMRLVGTWPELDFSVFEIVVLGTTFSETLKSLKIPLNFFGEVPKGTPLISMGFGFHKNDQNILKYAEDEDCKVYSNSNEYRFKQMISNDEDSRVWSFVHGCDSSYGDSGSAILNARTGEIIGILTAGAFPKPAEVSERPSLDQWFQKSDEKIWYSLSFATPMPKVHDVVSDDIADQLLSGNEIDSKMPSLVHLLNGDSWNRFLEKLNLGPRR